MSKEIRNMALAGVIGASNLLAACTDKEAVNSATNTPDLRIDTISTKVVELGNLEEELNKHLETLSAANQTKVVEPSATQVVTPTPESTSTETLKAAVEKQNRKGWEIGYSGGATEQMKNWKFDNLDPENWPNFPNVDNPKANFVAANGLEYGLDESLFAHDNTGDLVVAAGGYALYTGDYKIQGIDQCKAEGKKGCGILVVNVGEISSNFSGSTFDNGFVVRGRYWNGDELPQAICGGLSHAAYNMLNLSGEPVNDQANCSVREGCEKVRLTFVIVSGNELLVKGITEISK
ncbi:hypothetical protein ACFL1Q_01630 [Patescibacteria group bacterium]